VGIISWAIWGLFVGAFARLLLPGRQPIGCITTILLGVAGSLLGGLLATEVLGIGDTDEFDFGSFLIAVAVSVLLLALFERLGVGRLSRGERRPESDPAR
jgi:uncharacterized membrane protein YeaQ/YmgE (transglycosylase-associated protein family)